VVAHVLEAAGAARNAVLVGSPEAFDEAVTAGVSADLCHALSSFSARGRNEPFEITFRWARARPLDTPSHVVAFPPASESLLQAAAARLRGVNASGPATVTGVVSGLEDDSASGDRWRIKIRGDLRTERVEQSRRTTVWVRLADQATYDRAITAHREARRITVSGELSSTTGRVELVPGQRPEI
jgi:transposase